MLEAVSVQVDIYPRIRLHQTRLRKALPHRARWRGASNPNPRPAGSNMGQLINTSFASAHLALMQSLQGKLRIYQAIGSLTELIASRALAGDATY